MQIKQFEDKGLAQYSYGIMSDCAKEIVLIDPARDPNPYYSYAKANDAKIIAVVLTHSHADFISSHAEIHRTTGATIFASNHMEGKFPHQKINEGQIIKLGKITLKAIYTPGHSFDSISILLEHGGKDKAIFTGDTLFIGDVGRPDLRGNGENAAKMRVELAKQMFNTIHSKLKTLAEDIIVYPGHGAGTLCGKSLSQDSTSTIGREVRENYAFEERPEESFVTILLENQPFIPQYFNYDVAMNKAGAPDMEKSLKEIRTLKEIDNSNQFVIVDTRPEKMFKEGHLKGALNIQNGGKFETWLGTLVSPKDKFIVIAENNLQMEEVIRKAAKIGYELNIAGTMIANRAQERKTETLPIAAFKENQSDFTIVDIRNKEESADKIFENSINIPLPELKERVGEIPTAKPIVVHCAGGYRSAIGSSLLQNELPKVKVYDLSDAIKEWSTQKTLNKKIKV